MFHKPIFALVLSVFMLSGFSSFNSKPEFSYKAYGNIANYFENENDFLDFVEFKKGNNVAEIGAGSGKNLVGISILTDSISLYAEDIDESVLNTKALSKIMQAAGKYKKPLTNTYSFCIGTEKTTKLPDNTFDKILLVSAFHEFSLMDDMLKDIFKKLKPNGRLYILESQCMTKKHKNYSAEESIAILKKNNFSLIKRDGKDLNGASGVYRLMLEKTK